MNLLRIARDWVDLEKETLDSALAEAAPHAKGRMLDVGCGDKPYRELFAPYVTEHVGVDFAPTYEGSRYAETTKADFLYDGATLPFSEAAFDTVLSTQVLEHTPAPAALLGECVRVLGPRGILIVTVPFSFRVHSEPHDYFRYTEFGLRSLVEAQGLEVLVLKPRGGMWRVVGQKVSSHLALRVGRLGGSVQKAGGLNYEAPKTERPRYWTLPFVGAGIVAASTAARVLDVLMPDESDTLGYLLVARRPG